MLIGVTEARAKVGSIQTKPELEQRPRRFATVPGAQGELTQALTSLFAVTRRTRNSSRTRISATCRRSSKARRIASPSRVTATSRRCRTYNITVRKFPINLTAKMFGFKMKPNFTVANEATISRPPTVDFGTHRSRTPPPATAARPGLAVVPAACVACGAACVGVVPAALLLAHGRGVRSGRAARAELERARHRPHRTLTRQQRRARTQARGV